MHVNMKVLFTRTFPFDTSYIEDFTKAGIEIIHCPFIEIEPTANTARLNHIVKNLNHYDIAIFMSKWAAKYAMEVINTVHNTMSHLKTLWAAMGPGTAKMLQDSISPSHPPQNLSILMPKFPPYDSESFLRLPQMQAESIENKNVLILRGDGGRELMVETLKGRGARLSIVETYVRQPPNFNGVASLFNQIQDFPALIIITSAYALNNLVILYTKHNNIEGSCWNIPLIVVGKRLYEAAIQSGFTQVIFSKAADDQTLKDVMSENFST